MGVIYKPVFVLLGVAVLLALHRSNALRGKSRAMQITCYLSLACLLYMGLSAIHCTVQQKVSEGNSALARLVALYISKPNSIPNAEPVGKAEVLAPSKAHPPSQLPKVPLVNCSVSVSTTGQITSRLYGFGQLPTKESALQFQWQELFYDWTLSVDSLTEIQQDILIIVHDVHPLTDRVRVLPETVRSRVESQEEHWMSGFVEPRNPDSYTRTIRLSGLPKQTTAQITFRRPFVFISGENHTSQADFIGRTVTGSVATCRLVVREFNDFQRSAAMVLQFSKLAAWKYQGPDNPSPKIIMNPDEHRQALPPGATMASIEVHCKNDDCTVVEVVRMEAMVGKGQ